MAKIYHFNLYCYLWRMISCFLTRILQRRAIKRINNPHIGQYISLNNSHRIGAVTDAEVPGSSEAAGILRNEAKRNGLEFHHLCIDLRKNAENGDNIINRKDVNWYGIPGTEKTEQFLSKSFDILIDLSKDKRPFAVEYLMRSARSSLTIGIEPSRRQEYDIVISSSDTAVSIQHVTESIIKYLTSIR